MNAYSSLKSLAGFGVMLITVLALGGPVFAQTGYPMITSIYPCGLRRGTVTELTVSGQQNFAGAYAVLISGTGVTGRVKPPTTAPDPKAVQNTLTLEITATPDALPGQRELRVMTPRGSSTVTPIVVGSDPEAREQEPNNTVDKAGVLELPVTMNGVLQANEDQDCFRVEAQAGDTLVFDCIGANLQNKIHDLSPGGGGTHADPLLILTDATGREVASADDGWGPDPRLAFRVPAAGAYLIWIRDARYQGHAGWTYRLTCTRSAFLTAVYPMAGRRGESVSVEPVGHSLSGMGPLQIAVPMSAPDAMPVWFPVGGKTTNALPFVVSDHPQFLEKEGNDSADEATAVEAPGGINGRIGKPGDSDFFRFAGKKGTLYSFEVHSRRYGTPLDSFLQLLDADGRTLTSNDDGPSSQGPLSGKDSRIEWSCPADADYVLQVSDLHARGGEEFVYHLSAEPSFPDFSLRCDDDKALIGPGSGYAMYVQVTRRRGFSGEIKLRAENLPPGVTAIADRIPANMTQACVTLLATPDAKVGFSQIRILGTATAPGPDGTPREISRVAEPMQEIYMPGGGRSPLGVETHVASVTGPSDVILKLSSNRADLTPGGSVSIDVDVIRQNGYAKNVVLDVYLRHLGGKFGDPLPPGVSLDESASKTLLGPTENKGKIVLKASPEAAAVENLPIAVLGQISINFVVKVSHASEPIRVSVKR